MNYKDYYKILGVARDADADAIKRAYRKLARKYHPDVSKEKNAEERFKDVQEAYEALRDPDKRAAYDQYGEAVAAGNYRRPGPGPQGFEYTQGGAEEASFSDFFSELFGRGQGAPRQRGPQRGEDVQARIGLSLEQAFGGGPQQLVLEVPERGANGAVTRGRRTLEVQIPAGVRTGQRIRLSGQGNPGSVGGPAGDLYLEVEIAPHRHFRLDGADVLLDLPVTPWEAALGASVRVPTLGGSVTLKVPPGAQTGHRLRLRGRGMPGKVPGDQYVTLSIHTPPATTEAGRELYQRMEQEMAFDPRAGLTD